MFLLSYITIIYKLYLHIYYVYLRFLYIHVHSASNFLRNTKAFNIVRHRLSFSPPRQFGQALSTPANKKRMQNQNNYHNLPKEQQKRQPLQLPHDRSASLNISAAIEDFEAIETLKRSSLESKLKQFSCDNVKFFVVDVLLLILFLKILLLMFS